MMSSAWPSWPPTSPSAAGWLMTMLPGVTWQIVTWSCGCDGSSGGGSSGTAPRPRASEDDNEITSTASGVAMASRRSSFPLGEPSMLLIGFPFGGCSDQRPVDRELPARWRKLAGQRHVSMDGQARRQMTRSWGCVQSGRSRRRGRGYAAVSVTTPWLHHGHHLCHDDVGNVEVGVHILHVFVVLQGLDHPQHAAGLL